MSLTKVREQLIKETRKKVKESTAQDTLIVQAISHYEDLTKVSNILTKDLREWYSYYNPEFSKMTQDHLEFVKGILEKKDKKPKDSMGADLKKEDLEPIIGLAQKFDELSNFKVSQEKYLESVMKKNCPNITAIVGHIMGAQLIKQAGSLRKLIMMPSSTIQLLGAETALFRHIRTGAKCPKYGLLHNHPLVIKAKDDAGKVARIIASKLSIAARVDYGRGKFIGDNLMKEIEAKIK
jgi:nucleolar protein 56